MQIEKPDILFKECIIKPLEYQEGLITAIKFNKCDIEIQVRYFIQGHAIYQWFFDFDIELKTDKIKEVGFL